MPEDKTIYGDGTNEVLVSEDKVYFVRDGDVKAALSRAAFRAVVLGWQEMLLMEAEE
jgi:hypothetical protein